MSSTIVIIIGAAVIIALIVGLAAWLDRSRERGPASSGPSVALWAGPRRRAVAATLKVATSSTSTAQPTVTMRPSEEGSFFERILGPAAEQLGDLARVISPPGYAESVRRRLTIAGEDRASAVNAFLAGRVATITLIPVAFILVELAPLSKLYRLMGFLFLLFLLILGPEASLNRRARERQDKVRKDLPSFVDLLMISVEAGLGFDQALQRAVQSVPGPLGEEFSRFLGEVRMGGNRNEALEAVDERTDVAELRSFLMALIQAETFGVSIGGILRAQASEARIAQRQHAQEQAQKAPVKMLFPMVFCVLPALFIVVIGPAGIEIYHTLAHVI